MMHQVPRRQFHWLILLCMLCSCSSYREFEQLSQDVEIPTKIFRATYADTWSAVIKVIEQSNLDTEALTKKLGQLKPGGMIILFNLILRILLVKMKLLKRLNLSLFLM